MSKKCKITVIKREYFQDLAKEFTNEPKIGPCDMFYEGQSFIIDPSISFERPENFCLEAWNNINHYIFMMLSGEEIFKGWSKDKNSLIVCCTDGIRPVIFNLTVF